VAATDRGGVSAFRLVTDKPDVVGVSGALSFATAAAALDALRGRRWLDEPPATPNNLADNAGVTGQQPQ